MSSATSADRVGEAGRTRRPVPACFRPVRTEKRFRINKIRLEIDGLNMKMLGESQ